MTANDLDLLRAFARDQSQDAFTALVRRHLDLVYCAALRQVRSPQLAEEVAQSVFTDLARNAARLKSDTVLTAWLYHVTHRTAIDAVRRESRRQLREQIAFEMNAMNATDLSRRNPMEADWTQIEPLLDEAMHALDDTDRTAVLLRYFENKSLRKVGETLGTTDDAARKRVSRAVDRLREFFAKHGVNVGASGLVVVISANAVQTAPVGLAVTITTAAALAGTAVQISVGAVATKTVAVTTTQKVLVAVTLLMGVAAFILLRSPNWTHQGDTAVASRSATTNTEQNQQAAVLAAQEANAAEQDREPDPAKLLRAVAQARQRFTSGSMNFQLSIDHFETGPKETDELRLHGLFDGQKLRFESFGREYRYTAIGVEAVRAAEARAQGLDRPAAVRAGLLEGFEAHDVTAYDGAVLLTYRETDGRSGHADIRDPNEGSPAIIFDPRCLGLRSDLSPDSTVDNCLGYTDARSIKLIGKELVDGEPAWHVSVVSNSGQTLDFWIDVAHPARLLKHVAGKDYAVSKYDDTAQGDPLPIEVTTMDYHNGSRFYGKRFVRSNSQFNQPVDPVSFTLAGLNMAIGAEVSDYRVSRMIGYWTGAGLSETLPKKGAETPIPPKMAELLELLDQAPASPDALETASWILLNTPDGPEVEKAAGVILQEHTANTNLVYLCKELERVRPRSTTNLLEAFVKNNPSAEVRANACFIWATLRKEAAKYGENKQATVEAAKLYERVITEFGRAGKTGAELARRARPELNALRNLIAGKPAPETKGEDLDGNTMNLNDYRGKVVVLIFWGTSIVSDAVGYTKQLEYLRDKPVAIIGVNNGEDRMKAKASLEKNQITWPSFWDGRRGPICSAWNVDSWTTVFVLDGKGVIRYSHVENLPKAVEALLGE